MNFCRLFVFFRRTPAAPETPSEPAYGTLEYRQRQRAQLREQYSPIAERDRHRLYAIADMALHSSVERPFDLLIVDAVSGMLVGNFMRDVIAADARKRGLTTPEYIEIANSRVITTTEQHRTTVVNRLLKRGSPGCEALLITDTVETGDSLVRLKDMAAASGIDNPRYAILHSGPDLPTLSEQLHAPETDIFSYHGDIPAGVTSQEVKRHIGYHSVAGHAEPVPLTYMEYHGPSKGMIETVYREMANDYIASHITPVAAA